MAKNIGEKDEMRAKLRLIELRDSSKSICIDGKKITVESVKNNNIECKPIPKGIKLSKLSDDEVEDLAKEVGAFKAPSRSKADVYVNGYGISVKSHRGANPAFLNHTHRGGFLKVCERIGVSIDKLDEIIKDYWDKRKKGIINEDVKNNDPNSPFKNNLEYLRPILNYFLFTGTARGDSKYPADFILDFIDPLQEKDWKITKDEYLTDNWDHIIFSVRSKGMPGEKSENPKKAYETYKNKKDLDPWTEWHDGTFKGSLHGRAEY